MSKSQVEAFIYHAELERVVDGDTIDVTLDLGFNVKLHKQRCRLAGIDTPESRTRDLAEKVLGKKASARLKELCSKKLKIKSLGKGKYGRILAIPYTEDVARIFVKSLLKKVMLLNITVGLKQKYGEIIK